MPDEPLLREKAREAIRAGTLPSRRPDGTLGGPGSGGACALCRVLRRRDRLESAAEFESRIVTPTLRNSTTPIPCAISSGKSSDTGGDS